jgi:hypothetical protein
MAYFTIEQWVALSVLAGVGILSILRVLAFRFQHDREITDLRLRASILKRDYAARMAALKAGTDEEPIEVEVIGEIGPEAEPVRVAA